MIEGSVAVDRLMRVRRVRKKLDPDIAKLEFQFGTSDRNDDLTKSGSEANLKALERERKFLEYLKQKYNPQKVFYPGSGMDQLPREIFGKERCTYTSLLESPNYFKKDPPDFVADYRENPFPDKAFDFIYIHNIPLTWYTHAMSELKRVLKVGGIIVFSCSNYSLEMQERIIGDLSGMEDLKEVTPEEFKPIEFVSHTVSGHSVKEEVFNLAKKMGPCHHRGQKLAIFQKVISSS